MATCRADRVLYANDKRRGDAGEDVQQRRRDAQVLRVPVRKYVRHARLGKRIALAHKHGIWVVKKVIDQHSGN